MAEVLIEAAGIHQRLVRRPRVVATEAVRSHDVVVDRLRVGNDQVGAGGKGHQAG